MKKLKSLVSGIVMLLLVMLFPSCRKILDKLFPDHDGNKPKDCRIVKVKQYLSTGEDLRTGIVYNNAHGDPDSVIFDIETGSSGAHLFYFKYDASHRLVEYSGWYSREEDDYYFIHKYGYSGNLIVYDTTLWREAGTWTRMGLLEYDGQNRVIKETSRDTLPDGQTGVSSDGPTLTYTYNADGNLGTGYDDKVNFLRTSKTWMFTQRNYSKNNPAGATGYNDEDLPLGFEMGGGVSFLQFDGPAVIEYDCSENYKD